MLNGFAYLVLELWLVILLAGIVGLASGWFIWGRTPSEGGLNEPEVAPNEADHRQAISALEAKLGRSKADAARKDERLKQMDAELEQLRGATAFAMPDSTDEAHRPVALVGPRDGKADDLKEIEGFDADDEAACYAIGVFHMDQIAGWSDAEVAWVKAYLRSEEVEAWPAAARSAMSKQAAS